MNGLISDNAQETANRLQSKFEEIGEQFSIPQDTFMETTMVKNIKTKAEGERSYTVAIDGQDESEVQSKINEILTKSNGIITCTACGKSGAHPGNMRRHVQIHIEGMSYPCQICNKSFRSKNSLQYHVGFYHK